ncbi:MAG: DUF4058 family protein [Verrucomicrobiota bacterium]
MRSPFPGLDPYLEQFWSNVDTRVMTYICDSIQSQIGGGLWVHLEEMVTVQDPMDQRSSIYSPDVHVSDQQEWGKAWSGSSSYSVALAEPVIIKRASEATERWIEIRDTRNGGKVVTAIELLSPANKLNSTHRRAYRAKAKDFIDGGVNLVEIDLIRSGSSVLSISEELLPEAPYFVSVCRNNDYPSQWEIYPISSREPLPSFRIPLRQQDEDVVIELQTIFNQCYSNGGYHVRIDYTKNPEPSVPEVDEEWVSQIAAKGALD